MSTATLDMDSIAGEDGGLQYRALHTGSLIGLVLGALSVFVVITAANSFGGCLLVRPSHCWGSLSRCGRCRKSVGSRTSTQVQLWRN